MTNEERNTALYQKMFAEQETYRKWLRRTSNNINQVARRVHQTGNVYDTDLEDISQKQQELWEQMNEILSRLGRVS